MPCIKSVTFGKALVVFGASNRLHIANVKIGTQAVPSQ